MNILTPAQITAYKRKGWKAFQPGFDISYKSHWNTPWFVIREFFQNALDEHDQEGVKTPPSLSMSAKGVVIEDQGRGLGAESLLLREVKGEGDLRGRFGEGLKFACITAVRLGFTPVIESSSVVIQAYASPQTMGRVEATLLTFLYKEQEQARTGTRVTIEGYRGDLYRDRFTTFLGEPLMTYGKSIGRFNRRESVYASPKGRLYVGDIYIRDIEKSDFSYNLWGLDLNPDRVSELNNASLLKQVATLWALGVDHITPALQALKAMTTEKTFESYVSWDWYTPRLPVYWQEAWVRMFGQRAVISTDKALSKLAESYGYRSVGEGWSYKIRAFLESGAIPTDKSITAIRISELMKPKVLPDSSLSKAAQLNLKLVRFLSNACEKCRYEGKRPNIMAATIPPDPRTGQTFGGLCNEGEGNIYLVPDELETEETALSILFHEMGHWVGGKEAADGTMAHTKAVHDISASIFLIAQRQYAVVADILGTPVSPVAPRQAPPTGKESKLDRWQKYQTLS